MFDFILGSKKILGVDIGTSALKVLELDLRNGRPHLSNYAWMSLLEPSSANGGQVNGFLENEVPRMLKELLKKSGISEKKCYMSIPSVGALVTLIDFPKVSEKEMDQAIRFEAHKYIPTSLDEVSISWEAVGENREAGSAAGENEGKVRILLVAASKAKIISYEKVAQAAGLKLKGIEIESLSLVNSLVGNDKGNFLILDIGSRSCNILYVEKGIVRANRNIDAGGDDFTRTISKGMGITRERAEYLKNSGKNFFGQELGLNFSTLDLILSEIERISEIIPRNEKSLILDSVILSGGSAQLSGLKTFFEKKLGIRAVMGNPFSRIDYDKEIEPALEKLKSRFSVSAGLALRGIEEIGKIK